MRRLSRIERRSLLTGWIKWALLPAIPFCVLFFDAWLNVQVRYKDYELSQLNEQRRKLDTELDMVRAQEASLIGVEQLTEKATQLEMASPNPQQFKTVSCPAVTRRIPVMNLASAQETDSYTVVVNLQPTNQIALASKPIISPAPAAPAAPVTSESVAATQDANKPDAPTDMNAQPAAAPQYDMELGIEDMLGKL